MSGIRAAGFTSWVSAGIIFLHAIQRTDAQTNFLAWLIVGAIIFFFLILGEKLIGLSEKTPEELLQDPLILQISYCVARNWTSRRRQQDFAKHQHRYTITVPSKNLVIHGELEEAP